MPRPRKKMKSWGPRPEWLQRIVDTEVPPDYQARLTANHERLNREIDQSTERKEGDSMKIEESQRLELFEAARPLIEWMTDNCHPHCRAIVDGNGVELLEGLAAFQRNESGDLVRTEAPSIVTEMLERRRQQ